MRIRSAPMAVSYTHLDVYKRQQWEDVKVNIIDTPGHMDFLAEVYRSLSCLLYTSRCLAGTAVPQ